MALAFAALVGCATPAPPGGAELRGTWLTTTANTAIATPEATARTMQRLREIGINTVYVEVWKNGYTQFPSKVLERTIGVAQRPAASPQDPSERQPPPPRDLLAETLIEAHRNQLAHIAWFEYGFMAAHQGTMNHLRRLKPDWLSRDIEGRDVAPNGFVWMNPLHPEARRFLLDLVLEAVERYDLDGVQLDDRIVWPYVTMGYDETTRRLYAAEHGGREPPRDARDPAWMRWRAAQVDQFARQFVQELRAKRPGLVISLSPAVYPWSWEHYLLDWPRWAHGNASDRIGGTSAPEAAAQAIGLRWDEFIPQVYRHSIEAFVKTWDEQRRALGDPRFGDSKLPPARLAAGIRIVGDGADSSWPQLRDSIAHARAGGHGHVLWFSRGVLDLYARELQDDYARAGPAHSPMFPRGWRPAPIVLNPNGRQWRSADVPPGRWRLIHRGPGPWREAERAFTSPGGPLAVELPAGTAQAELLRDRRPEMAEHPRCRIESRC